MSDLPVDGRWTERWLIDCNTPNEFVFSSISRGQMQQWDISQPSEYREPGKSLETSSWRPFCSPSDMRFRPPFIPQLCTCPSVFFFLSSPPAPFFFNFFVLFFFISSGFIFGRVELVFPCHFFFPLITTLKINLSYLTFLLIIQF